MRVLVTRPEREGRATVARLAALGHQGELEPLTTIVAVEDPAVPEGALQLVTATSLNAVEVLAGRPDFDRLRGLPFLAVGDRTARAALDAGFTDVRSAAGDRRDLVAAIVAGFDPAGGRVLWLVGHDRAGDLVADLAPHGFTVEAVEVYRAEPVAALSPATRGAIAAGEIDAALVFSPRSGAILLEKLTDAGFRPASLGFSVHAISEATAQPFRQVGWRRIFVASSPNTDAMLATLGAAPPFAEAGDEEIRSSIMSSKSEKGRSKTGPEVEAPVEETAAPVSPAIEGARIEPETTPEGIAGAPETEAPVPQPGDSETSAPEIRDGEGPTPQAPEIDTPPAAPIVEPVEATRSAPKPAPAAVVAPAPKSTSGVGVALIAALLGGVVGIAGSYGLASKGLLPGQGAADARIAGLEATIAGLKAQKPAPAPVDAETAARIAALDKKLGEIAAAKPAATVDLSAIEKRIAELEAKPVPAVPSDLAERMATLEAAAKARLEATQSSVAGALAAIPADGPSKEALDRVAAQVDQALGALKEAAGSEIAGLKARIEALGAETKTLADRMGAETKALSERIGEMAATGDAEAKLRGEEIASAVAERMAALSVSVDAAWQKRDEAVGAALKALEQRLAAAEGLKTEIEGAIDRVWALENATKSVEEIGRQLAAKVGEAAAVAQGKVGSLENRLAGIETAADATRKAQAEAVVVMALADLKVAVDAGRPFAAELAVVKSASKGGLDLAALEPFAAKGVPGLATLRDQWPGLRRVVIATGDGTSKDVGVFERLLSHAGGMVKVRTPGDAAGTDVGSIVARLEARLAAGDLAGTLDAWKALPEAARGASSAWGAAVAARVAADKALSAQIAAVSAKLIQQSQ